MTVKLYFEDAFLQAFQAQVVDIKLAQGQAFLALNQTAFYPEGGGQPGDRGSLACQSRAYQVVDTQVDGQGIIWHSVGDIKKEQLPPIGSPVSGQIDWARRMDHMQQHTGEHLIAGCLYQLTGGFTHGLHIGHEVSTIDVTMKDGSTKLSEESLAAIEELANRRILEDSPVCCYFPEPEDLNRLPLRKDPMVSESVRVCAMGDYEMVACGGTHLQKVGQVGLVKLLSSQPARGKLRLSFLCGQRALRHYAVCYKALSQAGSLLSAQEEEVPLRLAEVLKQAENTRRELAALRRQNTLALVPGLLEKAQQLSGGRRLVMAELAPADLPALEALAGALTRESRLICLLCVPVDGRYNLLFARSMDLDTNMSDFIKSTGAKGGGRPEFARGAATDSLPWEAAQVMALHLD